MSLSDLTTIQPFGEVLHEEHQNAFDSYWPDCVMSTKVVLSTCYVMAWLNVLIF